MSERTEAVSFTHESPGLVSSLAKGDREARAKSTSYEARSDEEQTEEATLRTIANGATSRPADVESPLPGYTAEGDPLALSGKLKSPTELSLIRANTSSKRDGCGPVSFTKAARGARTLQAFYETQNDNITRWLRPVEEHVRLAKEFQGANQLKFQIAVQGSFIANIVLACLQLYAAISAGSSLSLFTTMADSIFDPLSNVTLIACHRAIKHVDSRRFPSGKARIETAGNIVFCFLMTSVSFIIIVLSIMELRSTDHAAAQAGTKSFHIPSIVVVSIAGLTKLVLFIYCYTLRNVYSQIRILWSDHRNDLFVNGFGLMTSVGGSKLAWWIDPMGAIILSVTISALWLRTAYSEFQLLIGVTADPAMLQWITYISMTHSPLIKQIDTVRAYHSGPRLLVEVDIVIDRMQFLGVCHDVAEALQIKLESLPDVERAYVHVDFETSHKPEHFVKKVL